MTVTHYVIEADGIKFIVKADENGWLRQVTTPAGGDGGTVFPPFTVLRTLESKEVEALYRE